MKGTLYMWVVYDHPTDVPEPFAARKFYMNNATIKSIMDAAPTDELITGNSLEDVRNKLPKGLHRLNRMPDDAPVIAEVWI